MVSKTTSGASRLLDSPSFDRLTAELQNMLTHVYDRSTNTRGTSLEVTRYQCAYAANNDAKFYMLFDVLVRDRRAKNESRTIRVKFTVATGDENDW